MSIVPETYLISALRKVIQNVHPVLAQMDGTDLPDLPAIVIARSGSVEPDILQARSFPLVIFSVQIYAKTYESAVKLERRLVDEVLLPDRVIQNIVLGADRAIDIGAAAASSGGATGTLYIRSLSVTMDT